MTFATDLVQNIYHELPTDTQVLYTRMEEGLARNGQQLHIESVMADENILEVVIRIRQKFHFDACT